MAGVVQINAALLDVEFIKDAVIANSQFGFRSVLKSLVREVSQSCTHVVHLRCTASRTAAGSESNALEKVADQIWSAAATIYFG